MEKTTEIFIYSCSQDIINCVDREITKVKKAFLDKFPEAAEIDYVAYCCDLTRTGNLHLAGMGWHPKNLEEAANSNYFRYHLKTIKRLFASRPRGKPTFRSVCLGVRGRYRSVSSATLLAGLLTKLKYKVHVEHFGVQNMPRRHRCTGCKDCGRDNQKEMELYEELAALWNSCSEPSGTASEWKETPPTTMNRKRKESPPFGKNFVKI